MLHINGHDLIIPKVCHYKQWSPVVIGPCIYVHTMLEQQCSMHVDLALPISAAQCNGVLPSLSSTAAFLLCLSSMHTSSALSLLASLSCPLHYVEVESPQAANIAPSQQSPWPC